MTPSVLRILSVMVVKTLRRAIKAYALFPVGLHAQQAMTTTVLQVLFVMAEAKTPATLEKNVCPQ
ncbi:MAG: hypothetical protein FWC18_04365 [Cystobacterineae bacterium]|nr:hypothetical protein [Cystobacterineae bacterium]MCL2259042.1 hypothetical protein [Cystobacterineae bacterium]